ncbi:hypothetical protein ACJX0J_012696, partial [Zea mays]
MALEMAMNRVVVKCLLHVEVAVREAFFFFFLILASRLGSIIHLLLWTRDNIVLSTFFMNNQSCINFMHSFLKLERHLGNVSEFVLLFFEHLRMSHIFFFIISDNTKHNYTINCIFFRLCTLHVCDFTL